MTHTLCMHFETICVLENLTKCCPLTLFLWEGARISHSLPLWQLYQCACFTFGETNRGSAE